MNVDQILEAMNRHQVAYLLIGGMNFLLRHTPTLTYDIDLWIEDQKDNLQRCEKALGSLHAEWGKSDKDWGSVSRLSSGWLTTQPVFCLTSPYGAIDIFRAVKGLEDWQASFQKSLLEKTGSGVVYRGLADEDMLQCKLSLNKQEQKLDRIELLRKALKDEK